MVRMEVLPLVILNVVVLQINAEGIDFDSIFHSPQRNYDDFEILERSNFEPCDDRKSSSISSNYAKDEPKAIANAQVLLTFPKDDRQHIERTKTLPIITSRSFVAPQVFCPHHQKCLYPYPIPYPTQLDESCYYPKDFYYHHPYLYDPSPLGIPPHFPNYIPKEIEPPKPTTPTCTKDLTSPGPARICQIYQNLLAIIEKMAQYLLSGCPSCNIKFDDDEKLKIAEALNIIIAYLNKKCRNIDLDPPSGEDSELTVEVSLILEDILSMLPITLLQVQDGKLVLINQLHCLLGIVKHIRATYAHVCGLCGIYKNMREMFRPCIFVKDCKSHNYLSKENIKGYLLMDSLNLALYLIHKNHSDEDMANKKAKIVDVWVDYLYRAQFLNCNERCAKKPPVVKDVKGTEQLLTKLRKLFLYQYALRLKETDAQIEGIDDIISFCTRKPIEFPITEDSLEICCKNHTLVGDVCDHTKNKITLDELLSLVENHLKCKYNFDVSPPPPTPCPTIPFKLIVNENSHPIIHRPICSKPEEPVTSKPEIEEPIHPTPPDPINLGPCDPLYPKTEPPTTDDPIDSNCTELPVDPTPTHESPIYPVPPIKEEPTPCDPITCDPVDPKHIHPGVTDPINLGSIDPICTESEPPIVPTQPDPAPPEPESPIICDPLNMGPVDPKYPIHPSGIDPVKLGSIDPIYPEPPQPHPPINFGSTYPVPSEPESPIPCDPINVGPVDPKYPIHPSGIDPIKLGSIDPIYPEPPQAHPPINFGSTYPVPSEPESPIACEPVNTGPVDPNYPIHPSGIDPIKLGSIDLICPEPPSVIIPPQPHPPINFGSIYPVPSKPESPIPCDPINMGPVDPKHPIHPSGIDPIKLGSIDPICPEPPPPIVPPQSHSPINLGPIYPVPSKPESPIPCDPIKIGPVDPIYPIPPSVIDPIKLGPVDSICPEPPPPIIAPESEPPIPCDPIKIGPVDPIYPIPPYLNDPIKLRPIDAIYRRPELPIIPPQTHPPINLGPIHPIPPQPESPIPCKPINVGQCNPKHDHPIKLGPIDPSYREPQPAIIPPQPHLPINWGPTYPILPPTPSYPINMTPVDPSNPIKLGPVDPTCPINLGSTYPLPPEPKLPIPCHPNGHKHIHPNPIDPIKLGPVDPTCPVNLGSTYPLPPEPKLPIPCHPNGHKHIHPNPIDPIKLGPVDPTCPINLGPTYPLPPEPKLPSPCHPNHHKHIHTNPIDPIKLGPVDPTCSINLGSTDPIQPIFTAPVDPVDLCKINPTCPETQPPIINEQIDREPIHPIRSGPVEPISSDPDPIKRGPQSTQPICREVACEPIHIGECNLCHPINLGDVYPKIPIDWRPIYPIYVRPELLIPHGELYPNKTEAICPEPLRPILIDPVKSSCGKSIEQESINPTYPINVVPVETICTNSTVPNPCDLEEKEPNDFEPGELGTIRTVDNVGFTNSIPCHQPSPTIPEPKPLPIEDFLSSQPNRPMIIDPNPIEPDICLGPEPPYRVDMDAHPNPNPTPLSAVNMHPTYINPQEFVLVPKPLAQSKALMYLPECPLATIYPGLPRSDYNILTSKEPVHCLNCCCSGNKKFVVDVDALNPSQIKGSEGDSAVNQPKDAPAMCGCCNPLANGRRCPYCAPYVGELDY